MTAHPALQSDCSRCFGLCCVALPFAKSNDFAIDKDAGVPCPNLGSDHSCGIHDRLRPEGFSGCTAYECFGAGQNVSQVIFSGRDWRSDSSVGPEMFGVFRIVRPLHELLWLLAEAVSLGAAGSLHAELQAKVDEIEVVTAGTPESFSEVDVDAIRATVAPLLREASALARARAPQREVDLAGADLFGADLRGRDLRGADLRGAVLVGADLRGSRLRLACLLGSDLRSANVRGADLDGALFLSQSQVQSAEGDGSTKLSATLVRPSHW